MNKNNLRVVLLTIALTGLFQFIHEAGHVVVANIYGSESNWGFSSVIQVWDAPPQNPDEWEAVTLPVGNTGWVKFTPPRNDLERMLFDSMGPIFSLSAFLVSLVIYGQAKIEERRKILLIGIFLLGFTLGFYYLRAHNSYWGDEKSLAYHLGISIFLFNIPLCLTYFSGMIFAIIQLRRLKFKFGQFVLITVTTIATGIAMNRAQTLVTRQVDAGNIIFNPILGFSIPVFLVFVMCFILFVTIWRSAVSQDNPVESELVSS